MEMVEVFYHPVLRAPVLLASFAGWPDAGEVATHTLRYLVNKLGARRFARIVPEEFYCFTQLRPHSVVTEGAGRWIRWQANDFYYWKEEGVVGGEEKVPRDIIVFVGTEPHLKWATYVNAIMRMARDHKVRAVITLGGTYDDVPHTKGVLVTGASVDPQLRGTLQELAVRSTSYEGPTSIHSVLHDACNDNGIPSASLWGHAPHYIQTTPNPRVCQALLGKLQLILTLDVDMKELEEAGDALEARVNEAIATHPELQEHIRRLEDAYGARERALEKPLSTEDVVREMEEFLKMQKGKDDYVPESG